MYYYANQTLPNVNDIVFVEILHFSGTNTYCKLLEYNDLEGFISGTELDKKVVDPEKQFKYGVTYPMVVLSTTRDGKISIDLSYKKVQKETRSELLLKFINVNKLYGILREFCFFTNVPFDIAQQLILFPKFNMTSQQYLSEAETLYKQYLRYPLAFFSDVDPSIEPQVKTFVENMKSRLTISKMIVYQQFRLWVMQSNSLEILKSILSYKSENCELVYVSSPKYQLTIQCDNEIEKQEILNKFLSYINEQKSLYKIKFELDESQVIQDQEFTLRPLNMTTDGVA
jgi:translation initiation factor 2 alpha subunit (eIF-2alpha)